MEIYGCTYQSPADQRIVPLVAVSPSKLQTLSQYLPCQSTWLDQLDFRARPGEICFIPTANGDLDQVLFGWDGQASMSDFAQVIPKLPSGTYRLVLDHFEGLNLVNFAKVWGLSCYEFTRYRIARKQKPVLLLDCLSKPDRFALNRILLGTYQVRDWINTPAEDYGPADISDQCYALANRYQATIHEVIGDDLLQENFPLIHLVGRASNRKPRMICLRWGNPAHRHLALIGKGVCFDTGGVQVKPASAMQTMKKDMAGAAHMLALAEMLMSSQCPVQLSVWIAAVDNSISAASYLPGDVVTARNGTTIEIGHTDAEGRLLLADLLSAASSDQPDYVIDYATLTGAQRVALGMELPAVFSSNITLAHSLQKIGDQHHDPVWPLPLYQPYKSQLDSDIADTSSTGKSPYGGAIIAALFLEQFVPPSASWLHIDASCFNTTARPDRPRGGEAMALEALFYFVVQLVQPV